MLFFICSDSGMTGTDVRVGSYRYLLNQQTLSNLFQADLYVNYTGHAGFVARVLQINSAKRRDLEDGAMAHLPAETV